MKTQFQHAQYCGISDYFVQENGVPILDGNGDLQFLTDFITANNFLTTPTLDITTVFENGVDFNPDLGHFRIPFIEVTNVGTIIIGTDIRHDSGSDYNTTDIGIKRSIDGGVTWSAGAKVLTNNGIDPKSRKNNGGILIDRSTGRIFIFGTAVDSHTEEAISGVVFDPLLLWDFVYTYSDDDGVTWSAEVSLKSLMTDPLANLMVSGSSCKGLTMADGTLVMPVYEGRQSTNTTETGDDWIVKAKLIYSTDHGSTWHLSTANPLVPCSEHSILEYETGKLMLIGRAYVNTKYIYTTDDLGATWTAHTGNKSPTLSGTPTEIGTHFLNSKTFLITCPENEVDRSDITLFRSKHCRAFMPFLLIDTALTYGYTCIAQNGVNLYMIYEKTDNLYFVDLTDYYKYLNS